MYGTYSRLDIAVHDGVLRMVVPRSRVTVISPDIFVVWMVGSSLIALFASCALSSLTPFPGSLMMSLASGAVTVAARWGAAKRAASNWSRRAPVDV